MKKKIKISEGNIHRLNGLLKEKDKHHDLHSVGEISDTEYLDIIDKIDEEIYNIINI